VTAALTELLEAYDVRVEGRGFEKLV